MAYSRITRFVAALCTAALVVWTTISTTVAGFVDAVRWPAFTPDPTDSIRMDRVRHELGAVEHQGLRRSRSFRMRALLHDLFTGTGFVEPKAVASA